MFSGSGVVVYSYENRTTNARRVGAYRRGLAVVLLISTITLTIIKTSGQVADFIGVHFQEVAPLAQMGVGGIQL